MTNKTQPKGVAIVGTQARGGIRAVIENHIQSGVYREYQHYFIPSHDEASALIRLRFALTAFLTLVYLLVGNKISICHMHGSMKGSIYRKAVYLTLCRLFSCKVIFHLHGSEFAKTYERSGGTYRSLVRYVLDHADSVFVLSDYWRDYVNSISSNSDVIIINNFPSPEYEGLFTERSFARHPCVEFLFLGYIGQRKGIYDLVDAVEQLKARGIKNFRITVGGNGEVEKLKSLITAKHLQDFFDVIGWVSGEQKYRLIQRADVLLLPSHNEGLPIAILEALSAGLAVISTTVGGIPDAISDDRYGTLVSPGKPIELAKAIESYINQDGVIEQVARNARKLYERSYSSAVNTNLIQNVLFKLA